MARTIARPVPDEVVNKVDPAKRVYGRAVGHAVGRRGMKRLGDKGRISKVVSGELVPDYAAEICRDGASLRAFVRSLATHVPGARVRVVIELDEDGQE